MIQLSAPQSNSAEPGPWQAIRVLHLEDDVTDSELIGELLRAEGFTVQLDRVDTLQGFEQALSGTSYALILCDYSVPGLDVFDALRFAREKSPDVPYIFVSGTIGEEAALNTLRHGATDYVLKNRIERLAPAVRRALQEATQQTLRKQAEEQLRKREQQLRQQAELLEHAPVVAQTLDHRILLWNSGMEKLYGFSREQALGRITHELLQTRFPEPVETIDATLLREGRWEGELEHRHRSGEVLNIASLWVLHRDEHGGPSAIVEINNDISRLKTAERALRNTEEQFLQAQKMDAVGQLAGGVAHDFNNMLAVIQGYATLLLSDLAPTDPHLQYVAEILRAAEHSATLTQRLLAFSRKHLIQPVAFDVNEIVQKTSAMLARILGESIHLQIRLHARCSVITADPGQVEQVILNLVINARDAMPQGGELVIETQNVQLAPELPDTCFPIVPGAYLALTITDTGAGMDASTQTRVFEPFFSTKPRERGTGLGLSSVHSIVKQARGNIRLISKPGQGTQFTLYFPEHRDFKASAPDAGTASPALSGRGETVLLVEDEELVRRVARSILTSHGYRVTEAPRPLQALALLEMGNARFDLLLTDIVMPEMSGQELARRVRQLVPLIKVLFMSGYADGGSSETAVLAPEVLFLPKPFTQESLLRRVRQALLGS